MSNEIIEMDVDLMNFIDSKRVVNNIRKVELCSELCVSVRTYDRYLSDSRCRIPFNILKKMLIILGYDIYICSKELKRI